MKILIIEDDSSVRDILVSRLKASGFVTDDADTAAKGLALLKLNRYDLIILDLHLPDRNGDRICQELREDGITIPILMLTVEDEVVFKVKLLEMGADDYVTKPFSFNELLARVKALLRRPRIMSDEVLYAGELSLDPHKHRVMHGDEEVYLTNKELQVLEYLMRRRGEVVSKMHIFEDVWGADADLFSNTLETHMMNLRRKLGKYTDHDIIKTIPGRGYIIY